jgi:hypothetical protein
VKKSVKKTRKIGLKKIANEAETAARKGNKHLAETDQDRLYTSKTKMESF